MISSETQREMLATQQNSVRAYSRETLAARGYEIKSWLGAIACWAGTAGFIGYEQSPGTVAAAAVTTVAGSALWRVAGYYRDHVSGCAERQANDAEVLSRLPRETTSDESLGVETEQR